jgi:hypothetical protein
VAVKNNVDVFYFLAECPLNVFFSPDGALEKSAYLAAWKDIPNESERVQQLGPLVTADSNALTDVMQRHNIFLIAKRRVNDNEVRRSPPRACVCVCVCVCECADRPRAISARSRRCCT